MNTSAQPEVDDGQTPAPPPPPSTVPATTTLNLRALGSDQEWNERFAGNLRYLVVECGRFMDLRLLEGVTVGFDYDDALNSVDLGYESATAKGYTKEDGLIGVGKLLRVRREDGIKAHIVIDAGVLHLLAEPEHPLFLSTANILAHELAHVNVMLWFNEHNPEITPQRLSRDGVVHAMRDTAHTIWEEYAACRLSARISGDQVMETYAKNVTISMSGAVQRARESIKAYRTHGNFWRLLTETLTAIAKPIKMLAYLLGHLDGLNQEADLKSLTPTCAGDELYPAVPIVHDALREAWETRHDWQGIAGVSGIVGALQQAMQIAGIELRLSEEGEGTSFHVPYTAATMPNGEADMEIIRFRRMLGLE
jgi:hypothetical protein